jgi:hypothetical protein
MTFSVLRRRSDNRVFSASNALMRLSRSSAGFGLRLAANPASAPAARAFRQSETCQEPTPYLRSTAHFSPGAAASCSARTFALNAG